MLLSGGSIVGAKILINQATSGITQTKLIQNNSGAGAEVVGNDIRGPINMLLVGIDERAGSADESARADTIVILHIPATHDQAYLVSIPRDWKVKGPGGGTNKITEVFGDGYDGDGTELEKRARGFDLLAKTLHKETGITFNGAAIIDFAGFEAVVEALGGVDMCIDQEAKSIHLAEDDKGHIRGVWYDDSKSKVMGMLPNEHQYVHKPGCRRMPAALALDYARIRKSLDNGDYDRQRHQQQLLKAIAKEATSKGMLTNPPKLNSVIKAAGKAFVLDTQGIPIEDFLFTLRGVAANDLVTIKTNAGKFDPVKVNGIEYEQLTPESRDMLAAVRKDTLSNFLINHPDFVGSNS